VRNAEFARVLGRVLHRPAVLPAPAWALRIAMGAEMANEALLGSLHARPTRLAEAGYVFRHATLEAALRAVL
jgi:NAD dependent epimerase/dehydratase family enzyme